MTLRHPLPRARRLMPIEKVKVLCETRQANVRLFGDLLDITTAAKSLVDPECEEFKGLLCGGVRLQIAGLCVSV